MAENYPGEYPSKPRTNIPLIIGAGCCGCTVLAVPILAAILFPVFAQARDKARFTSCMSNVKQSSLGALMYLQDYDERMPPTSQWMTQYDPYIKNVRVYQCPAVHTDNPSAFGYAIDSRLSRQALADFPVPAATPMIFESSNLNYNATDAFKSVPQPVRHRSGGDVIGFMDGHVRGFHQDLLDASMPDLSMDPKSRIPSKSSPNP